MYACVKRKHSLVSVCVLTRWHLCVCQRQRGGHCAQRKKEITALSSDILKPQPAEDRESFMKTDRLSSRDDRHRERDRLTERQGGVGGSIETERQRGRKRSGREKYSENEREESIQRVRGRGRACAVSLI